MLKALTISCQCVLNLSGDYFLCTVVYSKKPCIICRNLPLKGFAGMCVCVCGGGGLYTTVGSEKLYT